MLLCLQIDVKYCTWSYLHFLRHQFLPDPAGSRWFEVNSQLPERDMIANRAKPVTDSETQGFLMKPTDFYSNAHLVVAALRVLEHQNSTPPSIEDVCGAISISLEHGNLLCRKLKELNIIDVVEGTFGTRLFIKNHLAIEDIPRGEAGSSLEDELKKFKNSQKEFARKIESLQAEQEEKKKNLFAELEKKLKKDLGKT
jgi:hypothetical protein